MEKFGEETRHRRNNGMGEGSPLAKRILVIVLVLALKMFAQNEARWEYRQNDALQGKTFDELILDGTYVKPPTSGNSETPRILVRCENKKFRRGYLLVGGVAEHTGIWEGHTARSFKGKPQAQVEIRWDEERKAVSEFWELSDDRRSLLFDKQQLVKLMTGRSLGDPTDPQALLPMLYLGVVEAGANQIVMRFNMPRDPKQLVKLCGLQHVMRE
jgi:hypothetical protein